MSPHEPFDRTRLRIRPLAERVHDMHLHECLELDAEAPAYAHPQLPELAQRIVQARANGATVLLSMGAHVIKSGLSRFVIDLMERRLITHVAMNGAGPIHDFELALIGATTESVARYIRSGEFGLWQETGRINDAILQGATAGTGMGEAIGRMIVHERFPHQDVSILAAGVRLGIPATVHVGVGYDIIHEHPNCDGAALGATSYHDFLVFARSIEGLEGGVFLNFGSAVMGPEVYLKALAMARNVAGQEGREIRHFTTAVFDLLEIAGDYQTEAAKSDPQYYYRPWKTILVRSVADGGTAYYFKGDHHATLPSLRRLLVEQDPAG